MRTEHNYWTIDELRKNINKIEYPEFQREPTVWRLDKKMRLIDSILRNFDISSIYFYKKEHGGYDCIDGRQRINAILSYLGINDSDEDHNNFILNVENEIYSDEGLFDDVNDRKFDRLDDKWKKKIWDYQLNIVFITDTENDEELNLLFLRLQIASVLNAGEKLHAMTGDMRDWIFHEVVNHDFFKKINIPRRRYAKEQVAAQIALNAFSKRDNETFRRSRYVDLQDFFKQYNKFDKKDKYLISEIQKRMDMLSKYFGDKLTYISNRAIAVSVYLYASSLVDQKKEKDITLFAEFLVKLLKTMKWQIPKSVQMSPAYYDLLKLQTNIAQAAGEKTAIEKRHAFIDKYFYHYKKEGAIIGDAEYKKETGQDPSKARDKVKL
ncbi:MAG: hypothetical protein A2Z47_05855 [Thermodesulfovibrio sp. RBG_19FT_COMBO_42_12]|nr:MAG: hypothetical protein A2Z47_05855 [Thermodesulfovibrio sp. RBG_19FT_COMBO_42_12]HZX48541.1 DUF262 domain-containing protein [Nitrospirota bacterium]